MAPGGQQQTGGWRRRLIGQIDPGRGETRPVRHSAAEGKAHR